MAHY